MLKRSLKPLAAEVGDPTLDFRKLRRSHSTFYAVLNVHPRLAMAWKGHSDVLTTMKVYQQAPDELRERAAELMGELLSPDG